MSNLTETLQWEPSVNQLEVVDHLVGGPSGVLNTATTTGTSLATTVNILYEIEMLSPVVSLPITSL